MQIALVEGHAISTIKHPSMTGWRMLLVQPLNGENRPDGDPLLVVDHLGAGHGCKVLISNDGCGARELIGSNTTPVRWHVIGILDEE